MSTFQSYPLALVHRLVEPGPVVMVVTHDKGRANLMTNGFNMPVQHDPPVLALVVGPWDHSFATLRRTRECVIAIPSIELAERVVGVGNVSGRDVDKWSRFGFTQRAATKVGAPLVNECFANIECKVVNDDLLEPYNLWLLDPVQVWLDESKRGRGEFHHRGDGTFSVNGELVNLKHGMTKWQSLVEP